MRLTAAFAAHEWRTQARSLRFRVLATVYVAAASVPAVLGYLRRADGERILGGASYAGEVLAVLPALTAVFALLLSLDAILREQEERAWSTVSLAGLSSAGYLVRRWLALQAVVIPLTVVPLAAAFAASLWAGTPAAPLPFVLPWLLHVAPLAAATSALALGAGTIAGGTANAFVLFGLTVVAVPGLVNTLLARFGVRVGSPLAWLELRRLGNAVYRMTAAFKPSGDPWSFAFPLEMSDSPYDAGVAAEQYLAHGAAPVALAAAVLGLAVLYLRRTRPDVRPLRVSPTHPLRNFMGSLARLRERYTPDPVPARADLLALGLALLVTAGASTFLLARAHHYGVIGKERYEAEKSGGPVPTASSVVPGRWRIEGTVGPGRGVALLVTAEMRNGGAEPQGHLAFSLNPFVRIEKADAAGAAGTEAGGLRISRSWDRVSVDLTPPIPPGGSRKLRFRLAGEPAETDFPMVGYFGSTFSASFRGHLRAKFGRDVADLSKSWQVPSLSRRRVDLGASDLTPVPRYHAWKLDGDKAVPAETFRPAADLTLALAVPPGLFLADACGGTSRGSRGTEGRLASQCRLPLADLEVAGGHYQVLTGGTGGTSGGGLTVAVFPPHAAQGELHLGFLARGTRKLAEAWPGQGDLRRTVMLEWPEPYVHGLDTTLMAMNQHWQDPREQEVRTHGELVLLRELDLTRTRPLDPDFLVARLVASRLGRRRAPAPADAPFFQHLFTTIVLQRLGLGGDSGATVTGLKAGQDSLVTIPPPGGDTYDYSPTYWSRRFPALLYALQARMGEEALRLAIEEVLARKGDLPLTRNELYTALEERSEAPLGRMIQDFFVDGLLPELALDGVALHRTAGGWTVTGRMVNSGKGEALCRIVLTTDLGPVETVARAGTGEAAAFTLTTAHRPQAVWIDPDRQCHRLARNTAFGDRFYFEGKDG